MGKPSDLRGSKPSDLRGSKHHEPNDLRGSKPSDLRGSSSSTAIHDSTAILPAIRPEPRWRHLSARVHAVPTVPVCGARCAIPPTSASHDLRCPSTAPSDLRGSFGLPPVPNVNVHGRLPKLRASCDDGRCGPNRRHQEGRRNRRASKGGSGSSKEGLQEERLQEEGLQEEEERLLLNVRRLKSEMIWKATCTAITDAAEGSRIFNSTLFRCAERSEAQRETQRGMSKK